ncbi:MAG: alginate lyase family protein [Cyclobacteriaceae bacterium]|nr:alginate lyase family protein [Cyclobacteriaceae bacterium SS2]
MTRVLFSFILLSIQFWTQAQIKWQDIQTLEDLNQFDPQLIKKTLDQYDLNYPGLGEVKTAYESGDYLKSARNLLDYYRNNGKAENYRKDIPTPSNRTVAEADTTLKNVFIVQNVKGKVPYLEDGHRDWYYKGPNNDREWAWLSNRHSQLSHVLSVYYETGNPKYIEYIDLFLRDFILASMPYPAVKGSPSIWRGLEVAARVKVWTRLFYGLINNPGLSEASKFLILSSLPDHAHYNRNFHSENNWLTMEISALATAAAYFPEYKRSSDDMEYAVETMVESMKGQVYPDGVQTELTSHYHNVALINFELFEQLCEVAGKELPDFYIQTMEDMYSYIAHVVRPDGYRILNNDGDRGSDEGHITRGAEKYNKPEWTYIITNGAEGVKPKDGPSYFYPWAGHLVSRSGFDRDAHWSFFDIGPYGSSHQHRDKLHMSISAYGRDLLVDAGRFAYTGAVAEKYLPYARYSFGHNLILIDGQSQDAGPKIADEPVKENHFKITKDFDYGSHHFGQFIDVSGEVNHTRSMVYVRGKFWVVVDRVDTDRKREVTTMWHWHPDCEIVQDGRMTKTANDRGNLAVIPIGKQKYNISQVKGQEDPLQGWYSPEYNIYGPNVASLYKLNIKKDTNMAWLLLPSEGETPATSTRIISEDDYKVVLSVEVAGEKFTITVPFENSAETSVTRL